MLSGVPVKVWVGKIPVGVDDDFMEKLLRCCGPLKEWKRVIDPVTKAMKSFGFATWQTPHGALCGLRLLQGLVVDDDGALELKPGKQSEGLMDAWLVQGNVFSEADAAAAKKQVDQVLQEREQMPQRTKDVLKVEAGRAEKKRKWAKDDPNTTKEKDTRNEALLRRKREERMRLREQHRQEMESNEARAQQIENAWIDREKGTERARQRKLKDAEEERATRLQSLKDGDDKNVVNRKKRVAGTRRAREREQKEDADARHSKLVFSGSASLLGNKVGTSPTSAASSSSATASSGGPVALFAANDDEEEELRLKQAKSAKTLFVPNSVVDTLYRRKLTPGDVQKIVESIPVEVTALYTHPIDWQFLISIGALADDGKIREFVSKAIADLVGEMKDMVDFIMALLRRGCNASDLEAKMKLVLQEDAPKFVVKLWRFLIYHMKSELLQRE